MRKKNDSIVEWMNFVYLSLEKKQLCFIFRSHMPQHISAKRRVRVSEKKNAQNRANKTRLKNQIKDVIDAKTKEDAATAYKKVTSTLDKLAVKGVIHRNNAANKKSRLSKVVAALK